jgi:hypothetical protein
MPERLATIFFMGVENGIPTIEVAVPGQERRLFGIMNYAQDRGWHFPYAELPIDDPVWLDALEQANEAYPDGGSAALLQSCRACGGVGYIIGHVMNQIGCEVCSGAGQVARDPVGRPSE